MLLPPHHGFVLCFYSLLLLSGTRPPRMFMSGHLRTLSAVCRTTRRLYLAVRACRSSSARVCLADGPADRAAERRGCLGRHHLQQQQQHQHHHHHHINFISSRSRSRNIAEPRESALPSCSAMQQQPVAATRWSPGRPRLLLCVCPCFCHRWSRPASSTAPQ